MSRATAQMHAGNKDDALKTVQHLRDTKWEARFKNVHAQARRLKQIIEASGD